MSKKNTGFEIRTHHTNKKYWKKWGGQKMAKNSEKMLC
jgi:hypothetical protein